MKDKELFGILIMLIGIAIIIMPVLYWLFLIHWGVGMIGVGIIVIIIGNIIMSD